MEKELAIIGSGPSAIYILKHISKSFRSKLDEIHIFERDTLMGMGMPYNPHMIDKYNLANISSEEIPELKISFADWLRSQSPEVLNDLDIKADSISDAVVYSRIALGRYLNSQYRLILGDLINSGIRIFEYPGQQVVDIIDLPKKDLVQLNIADGSSMVFNHVIISTGHRWEEDNPESNYLKSPWPIEKILPAEGTLYNFTIGTLGASLSAFDVASTLAHRHGTFLREGEHLVYHKLPGAENFKIVMHSAEGWLPHLQYEQKNAFRKVYRYTSKREILSLLDASGFLRIETYFDAICRQVLYDALMENGLTEIATRLNDPSFSFKDFIEHMSSRHEYDDPFMGMRKELPKARTSINQDIPIYWKEAVDDLMYTLNFHLELLCAEDQIFLRDVIMPFLMNVIAALPLQSTEILLALYDAGAIELIEGKIEDIKEEAGKVQVKVIDSKDCESIYTYELFIACGGDKKTTLENYPFRSLVNNGNVREPRALFINKPKNTDDEYVTEDNKGWHYTLPGIDVDSGFRIIGTDGRANPRISDPTFTHIPGLRPYSYGLQACNAMAFILVEHLEISVDAYSDLVIPIQEAMGYYDLI